MYELHQGHANLYEISFDTYTLLAYFVFRSV